MLVLWMTMEKRTNQNFKEENDNSLNLNSVIWIFIY